MGPDVQVLLLADTHLGFDEARRPRVIKRRRGPDFWANYHRALEPALRGEVDLVVHGGDLLFRSKVPADLVQRAMQPLFRIADRGVPVALVPGNHERSAIPYPLLARHPGVLIFHRPTTFTLDLAGKRVALTGFACQRQVRTRFREKLEQAGWQQQAADLRLVCLHQAVEGAVVGPVGFTFRAGADVVCAADLPPGAAAVLSGHIHRHQILRQNLRGQNLLCPVVYPGSIERTAFAEKDEQKGFVRLRFKPDRNTGGQLIDLQFHALPTRPMVEAELRLAGESPRSITRKLQALLDRLQPDTILRLTVSGRANPAGLPRLEAAALRKIASHMNIQLRFAAPTRPSHPGLQTDGLGATVCWPRTSAT